MSIHWIIFIKYIVAVFLLCFVIFIPAYLARQSELDKTDTVRVRSASWLLGWTFIAWLWALFRSTKK